MLSDFRKYFSSVLRRRYQSAISAVFPNKMQRYFANPHDEPPAPAGAHGEVLASMRESYVKSIERRLKPDSSNVDGGLYVGVSGVAYMFYCLGQHTKDTGESASFYRKALEYIKPALAHPLGGKDKTSFLLGDAGNYAVAAAIFKQLGNKSSYLQSYQSLYKPLLDPSFLKCGGDEFFVGRASYLAGALWLSRELDMQVLPQEHMYKMCDVIVESGRRYAKKHNSPSPLMYAYYRTEYLGAAHGISFILQILLTIPGYLDFNRSAAKDIHASIDFLMSLQTPDGNWPCSLDEVDQSEHKLVHWCHGAPGVVYAMAKAYLVYKDRRYLESCVKAGEVVWKKGLLRKGPGICHGVAGNGYIFLLLYRLTGDEKYVNRAYAFANFLLSSEFINGAATPDNPYSLYEGTAGTVCFLSDLQEPKKAEFPFQNVFTAPQIQGSAPCL